MTRNQVWYLALCITGAVTGLLFSGQHFWRGMAFAAPTGFCMGLFLCPWLHGEEEG